jgi:hypothetical protein
MKVWEGVKLAYDPSQELSGEHCKSVNFSSVIEVSPQAHPSSFIPRSSSRVLRSFDLFSSRSQA